MFINKCIICEKDVPIILDSSGDDKSGLLPNIEGGTLSIHFGYGSKFDLFIEEIKREIQIQGCICDNCFDRKKHLTRKVCVKTKRQFKELKNDY